MYRSVPNLGRRGIAAAAISAVDIAPVGLEGPAARQSCHGPARRGQASADLRERRIHQLRQPAAAGPTGRVALPPADSPREDQGRGVEPVSSDDLVGLASLRAQLEPDIAAGKYSWTLEDSEALLNAGAVDCLQLDVTRCAGITGFVRAAQLARTHGLEVCRHCAPNLHAMRPRAQPTCDMSNTSMIISGSRTCSSRDRYRRSEARSGPIATGPASAWSFVERTLSSTGEGEVSRLATRPQPDPQPDPVCHCRYLVSDHLAPVG